MAPILHNRRFWRIAGQLIAVFIAAVIIAINTFAKFKNWWSKY